MFNKQINIKMAVILPAIIIAGLIASPFVYAAVEPHIIIQMDAAQTTSPFTIQDDTSADQFSINSDGIIDLEGGHIYTIRAYNSDIFLINATEDFGANANILAGIKFIPTIGESGSQVYTNIISFGTSEMIQDIGTGNIQIGWEHSEDNISWSQYTFCTTPNPTWNQPCTKDQSTWELDDDVYFRITAYNSDGATSGAIANYNLSMKINVPPGWTVDPAYP